MKKRFLILLTFIVTIIFGSCDITYPLIFANPTITAGVYDNFGYGVDVLFTIEPNITSNNQELVTSDEDSIQVEYTLEPYLISNNTTGVTYEDTYDLDLVIDGTSWDFEENVFTQMIRPDTSTYTAGDTLNIIFILYTYVYFEDSVIYSTEQPVSITFTTS